MSSSSSSDTIATPIEPTPTITSTDPFIHIPTEYADGASTSSTSASSPTATWRNPNAFMSSPLYIYTFAIALGILILLAFTIFLRAYLLRQRLRAGGGRRTRRDDLWWLDDEDIPVPIIGMRKVRHVGEKPVMKEVWIEGWEKEKTDWADITPLATSFSTPAPPESLNPSVTQVFLLPSLTRASHIRSRTTRVANTNAAASTSQQQRGRSRSRSVPRSRTYSMPTSSSLFLPPPSASLQFPQRSRDEPVTPAEEPMRSSSFLAQVVAPNPTPGHHRRRSSSIANVRERRDSLPSSSAAALGVRERRTSLPLSPRTGISEEGGSGGARRTSGEVVPPVPVIPVQYLTPPGTAVPGSVPRSPSSPQITSRSTTASSAAVSSVTVSQNMSSAAASQNPSSATISRAPSSAQNPSSRNQSVQNLSRSQSTTPVPPTPKMELRTTTKELNVDVLILMPSLHNTANAEVLGGEMYLGRYTSAKEVNWEEEVVVAPKQESERTEGRGRGDGEMQEVRRRRFGFRRR